MRTRIIYQGKVRGVGFRATARNIAQRHRVSGFVRNLPDLTVELEIQGEPGPVQAALDEIAHTMARNIRHAHPTPLAEVPGESGFVIR